jgi:hypothetical protein
MANALAVLGIHLLKQDSLVLPALLSGMAMGVLSGLLAAALSNFLACSGVAGRNYHTKPHLHHGFCITWASGPLSLERVDLAAGCLRQT